MAGNVYTWSTTAATNSSADSDINWAEGQLPGTVNDSARGMMAGEAGLLKDNNATLSTAGSANAYTVTSNIAIVALATGLKLRLKANFGNTGACTLNVTPAGGAAFGAKAIKVLGPGGEADPAAGAIQTNGLYDFNYDSAANAAAGAWILISPSVSTFYSGNGAPMLNGAFSVTAAGSALTIALKTRLLADPSATDPVFVFFRNATGTTGDYTSLAVTAATSVVISSGSTLGVTSSTAFRVWIVGFNDAGTFRLGAINCSTCTTAASQIFPLVDGLASSTAEGGAGAADSAGIIYTGTAVTAKAMRILGFAEWSATGLTAGTWTTTNLLLVQLFNSGIRKPGESVQIKSATFTIAQTNSSTTYVVGPLILSITPNSAANPINVTATGTANSNTADESITVRLSRGGTANTNMIGTETQIFTTGTATIAAFALEAMDLPNTTSSQQYSEQHKSTGGGSVAIGNSKFATMKITELMG